MTDTAPFAEVLWSPDGKDVTVFMGDRAQKVTVRPFQLDGTPGAERSFTLSAAEYPTKVAYDLADLSADGRQLLVQRATAEIKRNYRPDVIVDDPLATTLVVDLVTGLAQRVLERYEWGLGWLDCNRMLPQRDHLLIGDRKTEDGRLTVVSLP